MKFSFIESFPDYLKKYKIKIILFCIFIFACSIYFKVKDSFKLESPAATALIIDTKGYFLSESPLEKNSELGYWDLKDKLPIRIKAALLTVEDKRFYQHIGVDFHSIVRAIWFNFTNSGRQGASTIAMQVARMQNQGERTYWKKICELITAIGLINKYGHEEVLRHYLKIVPQGNRIHGVAYAARRFFQKPLEDISWAEAALLAALPKAPGKMNLYQWDGFKLAQNRAKLILKLLLNNKSLDQSTYQANLRQLNNLILPAKETRPYHSYHAILRMEDKLKSRKTTLTFQKPLKASLDLDLQDFIDQIGKTALDYYQYLGAGNISILVADKKTGSVLGYLGSANYDDSDSAGKINYANIPRSTGSTLKPFIYALGLESKKFSPASILPDIPLSISQPKGIYTVSNYDERYLGPILYRKALANSRNIPAVYVLKEIGLKETYNLLKKLRLVKDQKDEDHYGLSLAVGGFFTSLEDLVTAYGTLANEGKSFKLKWFTDSPKLPKKQIISQETAQLVTLFLSDPQARLPSFSRMGQLEYPFPVAVKTGTSQGFRDAWTVAWSSKYIVGVWIGDADNRTMKKVNGLSAADLVQKIILHLNPKESRGINEKLFPAPDGYKKVKLCALTGAVNQPDCPENILEYVKVNQQKNKPQNLQLAYSVDSRTGTPANESTPVDKLEIRNFLTISPEFAEWKERQGFSWNPTKTVSPWNARILIQEPLDKSVFIIDQEIPLKLQTIPLRAKVVPAVPNIDWYLDGKKLSTAPWPYKQRWQLAPGVHTFKAFLPKANVFSETVKIKVLE